MLNATVGVQRLMSRLRTDSGHRSAAAVTFQRRSLSIARAVRAGSTSRPRPSGERLVSITAVGLVAVAIALSNLGSSTAAGPTGNTSGAGSEPRIALGGAVSGLDNAPQGGIDDRFAGGGLTALAAADLIRSRARSVRRRHDRGPFSADGTLLKPVSVDTTVADGSRPPPDLPRSLGRHADRHRLQVPRVDDDRVVGEQPQEQGRPKIGQTLTIPPVNGVVVTVQTSDTLETLAARYRIDPADIIDTNQLNDPVLVVGQTLTIPGARSARRSPRRSRRRRPSASPRRARRRAARAARPARPPTYTGGKFAWPVAGGYISQYFHYGHYAIDIAADYGDPGLAAAAGTVIFAGWKNNGGGYQVWIAHGSGLYTTYNHMSAVVGRARPARRARPAGRPGRA